MLTGREEFDPQGLGDRFQALLDVRDAVFAALRDRLSQFDRDTLVQLLGQREDFSPEEADQLIGRLETQMKAAAKKLEFEEAGKLRDRIKHLRDKLLGH